MNLNPEEPHVLAAKILEADLRLEKLDKEIQEIGQPAGKDLKRRLDVLKIEENALKRNFAEARTQNAGPLKMRKIGSLLRHIEREESSVEEETRFLHQAAPSSMILAVEAGQKVVELYRRGLKKVIGNHHPLGESVFVNHTHDHLASQYGIRPKVLTNKRNVDLR